LEGLGCGAIFVAIPHGSSAASANFWVTCPSVAFFRKWLQAILEYTCIPLVEEWGAHSIPWSFYYNDVCTF
jgi:hypothetical protein